MSSDDTDVATRDIIKYLKLLIRLNETLVKEESTTNIALGRLADALTNYSSRPFAEVEAILKKGISRRPKDKKSQLDLKDVSKLSKETVKELVSSTELTKGQLIQIGIERFGISRSRLQRENIENINEAIMSALDHEKSLEVISKSARQFGTSRES
jgi:hypothetical protein